MAPSMAELPAILGKAGVADDLGAPSTPCQKASSEPAPAPPRKKYSNQAMLSVYEGMGLMQLTAAPCWTTSPSDGEDAWPQSCFATREQVLINLASVPALLLHKEPSTSHAAHSGLTQYRSPFDIPAQVIQPHWTPAQKAAAYAACTAYQAATLAAAALRPIHTRPSYSSQRSSSGASPPTTPFNNPAEGGNGRSRLFACQHSSRTLSRNSSGLQDSMQDSFGRAEPMPGSSNPDSLRRASMPVSDSFGRAESLPGSSNPGSIGRAASLRDSNKAGSFRRASSTATSCPQEAPSNSPGREMWEQGMRKLLGLHGDSSSMWLVQAPHITGAMGPIPGEDMERWLLHGVPPKQLGRAIHRPVLEATAADPASLLVCGLLSGEVEKNLKPGRNAFKPLRELLPGLSMGFDYSFVTKGLVDNRHPNPGAAADTSAGADQAPQPDTPTASSCKNLFDPQSCSAQMLVSRLQHMPAHQTAGMTAAADEIARRAHGSAEDREALVREGAVGALLRVLQLPAASSASDSDQAYTICHTAACWALHYLLGRSTSTPQGCTHAQAAMAAANAAKHLTKVLQAAWQADGGASKDNESPAGSPVSEGQQRFGPSAKLQKAAAVVLAGLATTPEGKQAILQEGTTISSIVRLLGSLCAEVSAAALSVVRNLSNPEDSDIHKTLFKLGVFNMLVHVVARHKDLAVKQNALKVLLDLASTALSSPSSSPVKPAGPFSTATAASAPPAAAGASSASSASSAEAANEYTAENAVDRLAKRGLPVVLLKLLHKDPPVALQARAVKVLQLMAVHKPQVVLCSIKDLVEYEPVAERQEEQRVAYTGVQVLQRLMQSSTSDKVQAGAMELLQALTDAGLIGRAGRCGRQAQSEGVQAAMV